jgi:hypothetical protein
MTEVRGEMYVGAGKCEPAVGRVTIQMGAGGGTTSFIGAGRVIAAFTGRNCGCSGSLTGLCARIGVGGTASFDRHRTHCQTAIAMESNERRVTATRLIGRCLRRLEGCGGQF